MTWTEIIFWVVQGVLDLFLIMLVVFLSLALNGFMKLSARYDNALKEALFTATSISDDNFKIMAMQVSNIAKFLIKQFNLDENEPVAPKKVTPSDWKN